MPISFKKLFLLGILLTLMAGLSPVIGFGVFGGLACVYFFSPIAWVRWFVAAVVILTVGIPSLFMAVFFYGLIWVVSSFVDSKKAPGEVPHQKTTAQPSPSGPWTAKRRSIPEGEFIILSE